MRLTRLRAAVGLLSMLGALAAVSRETAADAWNGDPSLANPNHFVSEDGAVLYRAVCQGCHMSDGQGAQGAGRYPSLANDPKLQSALFPAVMVVNGSKAMPPLGAFLSDAQVAAVVNYVRANFGNHYEDVLEPQNVHAVRK